MAKDIEEKIGAMSQKNCHGLKYKYPLKNYRVHEMPTGNQLPPHYPSWSSAVLSIHTSRTHPRLSTSISLLHYPSQKPSYQLSQQPIYYPTPLAITLLFSNFRVTGL